MPEKLNFSPAQLTQNGESFALWRLPGETSVQAIIGKEWSAFLPAFINEEKQGFAFVPFIAGTPVFLSGEYYAEVDIKGQTKINDYHLNTETITFETKTHYQTNVAKAIGEMKNDELKKVVLARNTIWEPPSDFCPLQFYNRLIAAYPEAFVSLVSIKEIGTWIGATPELLLQVSPQLLKTVALAGTQLKNNAQWSEKESEEQLWVVRYIEEILEDYQVTEVDLTARKLIVNGPLEHLYTEIFFKKEGTENTELAAHLLTRLHPTPAVCGLPENEAKEFILTNEDFFRSYYSGYLGPVNRDNTTSLFVNLRCLQLTPDGLVAYAGAGITKDSIPEKELIETENKLNNLKLFV